MKIHLIKKQSIEDYVKINASSKTSFGTWLSILKYADWNVPADIISTFNSADILGDNSKRVVFNIGGNHYRMICKYYFGKTMVHLFIKWIGTHAEYSKICKEGKQYDIDNF
ncbi:MAG: type II toxin-antitoxin system HigB family toxin [Candidatus Cyclobacteriaceae bacterium M3_2C_046]